VRINLTCRECGGNRFTLDRALNDLSRVDCEDCGHKIGTLAQLKKQVAEEVLNHSSTRPRSH